VPPAAAAETAATRCNLLYQQAVFASRESAQLESEIRRLREREAMRECTFRPKLLPRRGVSPRAPQPRNFDLAVSRLRSGQRQREELHEALRRIPAGENYERLRRLGTQPFSCYFRDRPLPNQRGPPLYYVDVDVGKGRTGRIGVHEGDDLRAKAKSFARAFQLDRQATLRLQELLHEAYDERMQAMDLDAQEVFDPDGEDDGGELWQPRQHPAFQRWARSPRYQQSSPFYSARSVHSASDGMSQEANSRGSSPTWGRGGGQRGASADDGEAERGPPGGAPRGGAGSPSAPSPEAAADSPRQ